jgi:hypothetical protein
VKIVALCGVRLESKTSLASKWRSKFLTHKSFVFRKLAS